MAFPAIAVLVRNTMISGLAFLVVSVLGLVVIPVLIDAYGLAEFGLIMLVRMFLPAGLMSVLDFGLPELATQTVARARGHGDWGRASGELVLLGVFSLGLGLVLGIAVIFGAGGLVPLFSVDSAHADGFVQIVTLTGAALVVLIPSLVMEGILKGLERYGTLRLIEVTTAVGYTAAALAIAVTGQPYDLVALAFLGSVVVRGGGFAVVATGWLRRTVVLQRWSPAIRRDLGRRAVLMVQNRILGALQAQAAPLVIGVVIGPTGVGTYEALVRLPRFAKVVLALLNSALLPVATLMEERRNLDGLRRLGHAGNTLLPSLIVPLMTGCAVFSEDILRVWLGPQFKALWPWMAVMFLVPLLNALIGYGQTLLMVRPHVVAAMNRWLVVQIVLMFALALLLVETLRERSFILGQVVAMAATFPFQMRILVREADNAGRQLTILLAKLATIALILAVPTMWWKPAEPMAWPMLVIALAGWNLGFLGLTYWLVLTRTLRDDLHKVALVALGKSR